MNDSNKPYIEESSVREQDEKQKKKNKKNGGHISQVLCTYIYS